MTRKPDPPPNAFAQRLDEAIAHAGTSQGELSRAIGAPQGYLSKLRVRGAQRIEPSTLFAIADALGVNPRWLFTGHGSRDGGALTSPAGPTEVGDAARLRTQVAVLEEAMHAIEVTCRGALRRARR